jgi:hypothetical protein
MKFLLWSLLLCFVVQLAFAQDRYVVRGKEAIPIPKNKSSVDIAIENGWVKDREVIYAGRRNDDCRGPIIYTVPCEVNFGFNDGDVALMRLLAPVTGVIETVYFRSLTTSSLDSSCVLRIFESAFTPSNPEPSGSVWLGYYEWPSDPIGLGNAPYDDTPGVRGWIVGDWTASPLGFNPNGAEIWGSGGYATTWHSHTVNSVAMSELGVEPMVNAGDYFNVNIRTPPSFFDTGRYELIGCSDGQDPADFLKYYYSGRFGFDYGWWTRVEWNVFIWAVIRATENTPPVVTSATQLNHTIDIGPRMVCVRAYDCNPSNPADTGIVRATLYYSVDGGSFTSVTMTGGSPQWCADIPSMTAPALIEYYAEVEDNLGLTTETLHHSYRAIDLNQAGYMTDYGVPFNFIDIAGTGTPILLSEYFDADGVSQNANDGTAGPFDIGGDYEIFGGTGRYAWIGVNGAICLSSSETDTIHVSPGGFTSWEIPNSSIPPNFISAFWNDLVVDPALGGQGVIYYEDLGNMFVVQYQDVGNFNDPNDGTTFQIILDRTAPNHKVWFQYLDVGAAWLDLTAMIGLQGDTSVAWLLVNSGGYPVETRAANGKAIALFNENPMQVQPRDREIPQELALYASYPNPFNPSTAIKFDIPVRRRVRLNVYDILGRTVAVLMDEVKEAGTYTVNWDASRASSGVYFYRLKSDGRSLTKKMVLTR